MAANQYHFVETWFIPGFTPEEVYNVISNGTLLPQWWRGVYLEAEALDNAQEPVVGAKTRVKARGFLPYKLNFILEATQLTQDQVVEVTAHGDFEGVWRATMTPKNGGTHVEIDWKVTVQMPLVRYFSPILKPLFAWNHYWTTPRGEAGLIAYLTEQKAQRDKQVAL